jgi:hypothetical protein
VSNESVLNTVGATVAAKKHMLPISRLTKISKNALLIPIVFSSSHPGRKKRSNTQDIRTSWPERSIIYNRVVTTAYSERGFSSKDSEAERVRRKIL